MGAEEGPRKMFNSILTFLTRKGISKASRSQMCLRGTWFCKKFNIRTSEWLHLGHQRATVLRSLPRTECDSREKRCERQGRAILPLKNLLAPTAGTRGVIPHPPERGRQVWRRRCPNSWSRTVFRHWAAATAKGEFATSRPPFTDLDFVLHLVQYLTED